MICFDCKKDIEDSNYMMVGLDIPYVNIYFHKICYLKIKDINVYFTKNVNFVYNYSRQMEKNSGKRRKNLGK